jgi:hypothetical protein
MPANQLSHPIFQARHSDDLILPVFHPVSIITCVLDEPLTVRCSGEYNDTYDWKGTKIPREGQRRIPDIWVAEEYARRGLFLHLEASPPSLTLRSFEYCPSPVLL